MDAVDEKSLLKTFIDLCRIYSPTFQERAIAGYVMERLVALGIEPIMDAAGEAVGGTAGNVIGTIEGTDGSAPTLLIDAHLDTVEPALGVEPVVEGDIVRSVGETILGADDKIGVAVMLEAARVITERKLNRGRVNLVFTVAEEKGLKGAKELDLAPLAPDFAFVLDSDGPVGAYIVRSPFHEMFEAEFIGRAAHAGVQPEEGVNAIQAAAKAISGMKLGRIDEETTANVGRVEGGRASNIIPDRVTVIAEARSFDISKLKRQVAAMTRAFEAGAAEVGAELKLNVYREYDGYSHAAASPLVAMVERAAAAVGVEAIPSPSGGGSDANVYNARGVPSLNLSLGGGKVHTVDEFASVSSMVNLVGILLQLVETASY